MCISRLYIQISRFQFALEAVQASMNLIPTWIKYRKVQTTSILYVSRKSYNFVFLIIVSLSNEYLLHYLNTETGHTKEQSDDFCRESRLQAND